jgi:hypothetical protein
MFGFTFVELTYLFDFFVSGSVIVDDSGLGVSLFDDAGFEDLKRFV